MFSRKILRTTVILLLIIINIGCDQLTKSIVRRKVMPFAEIHLLDNHLTITKVENTGAFLSAGHVLPGIVRFIVLSLFPMAALLFGVYYVITRHHLSRLAFVGLSFIIGGGIGNVFDRMYHGSVTDFLHIRFGIFQTGIFNMADVSIMTGGGLLLLSWLLSKKKATDTDASKDDQSSLA
jgi:signal peptidase II